MTDNDDFLLNRLRDADPVDPATLPDPADPTAQQVLRRAMTAGPALSAAADEAADVAEVVRFVPPPQVATARTSWIARSRGRVLAGAAVAAAAAVGLFTVIPGGTAPALAAVQDAAAGTASVGSGRVTSTFDLEDVDQDEAGVITVEAAFSGSDVEVDVVSIETDDPTHSEDLADAEFRLVDDVAYINEDGTWRSMEVGGALGSVVIGYLDPRSVLDMVNQLTEADEIGAATVDGVEVTHYRGVVDLAGESVASLVAGLDMAGGSAEVEGEATLDIYIDGAGLLRLLEISGDASEPGGDQQVRFAVSTSFNDLGADISIEAPADAEPFSLSGD